MKKVYDSLRPAEGVHNGGVIKIEVVPKEWLSNEIEIDFNTGTVNQEIGLITGKSLLTLQLIEDSYEFEERPKSGSAGTFFEISISGLLNTVTAEVLQQLESLRQHELVVICTDRDKLKRIVGTKESAMIFQFGNSNRNNSAGKKEVQISMFYQSERTAPFYSTLCTGYLNFTDVAMEPDIDENPGESVFDFSGGNTVGDTEVEIDYTGLLGEFIGFTKQYVTVPAGQTSFNIGYDFLPDFGAGILIVRWRRKCATNTYSAWKETRSTLNFTICDGISNFTTVERALIPPENTDTRFTFSGGNLIGETEVNVKFTQSAGPSVVYDEDFIMDEGETTLDVAHDFFADFGSGTLRVTWRRVCQYGYYTEEVFEEFVFSP
jgi:hypothetical protein